LKDKHAFLFEVKLDKISPPVSTIEDIRGQINSAIHLELDGGALKMYMAAAWLQGLCKWKANGFAQTDTLISQSSGLSGSAYKKVVSGTALTAST
jgi:hypothetical protein